MAISTTSITTWNDNGTGTWLDIGGGGGSAQNLNVFITNGGSRGRKVSNAIRGFGYQLNAAGQDISGEVMSVRWATLAGVGSLDTRTLGGVSMFGQDTSGNISYWDVDGADTYSGGWKVSVMDMSVTPSRNNGTNATLTSIQYFGMVWDATANVGGGDDNCLIDEILSWPQAGLVITGNTTSFIDDLVDVIDLNSSGEPHAIFERRSGIVFSKARLIIRQDATDISESDRTLVFENPVYDAGSTIDSCLAEIGMENDNATAGELITWTRCSIISADPDEAVTTDANREFDYTLADNASFDTCQIQGFDGTVVHLGDSSNSYDDCTFSRLSQIADSGAVVRRGFVRDTQAAATEAALLWTSSSDWEDTEFVMGATNSHAIEIETNNLTDTWTGFTFTGYATTGTPGTTGNEVLNNQSTTGTVTINASDITGTITYYNRGGGATVINNNVTLTFTNLKDNTEVRIYNDSTGVELDGIENATAGSPGARTFGASVAGSTVTRYIIHNVDYEYIQINGFTWPSSNQSLQINQRLDLNYENP